MIKQEKIRNIGIMAHIDAGKTTLTERVLYYSGRVHRIGEVDAGSAVMDWMAEERERGITITSAATTCFWNKCEINIIDTPGHIDFVAEVERTLRVLDGAIALFCGVGGVQAQSEAVWNQAERYGIPRIAFINKLDRLGADFFEVLNELKKKLGEEVTPLQLPIGSEADFQGVIDLLEMRGITWEADELGAKFDYIDIPSELLEQAVFYREKLIERIVEEDDVLMEKYLEGEKLTITEIKHLIRKATLANRLFPALCGSALKNKGIQPLIDAVIDYLPSPSDLSIIIKGKNNKGEEVQRMLRDDEPYAALAFKTYSDSEKRRLTYIRIYSGKLKEGQKVYNQNKRVFERIDFLYKMHSNKRERIKIAYSGEIVATTGLRQTVTGETLSDKSSPIILMAMEFPEPVISVAIEPRTISEGKKLKIVLNMITFEDPTFRVKEDPDTGQTIIWGMGELHLEVLVHRLKKDFKLEVKTGKPQVSYRESVSKLIREEVIFIKQVAGQNQKGHVILQIEPTERGIGASFKNEISNQIIPSIFIAFIEDTVNQLFYSGIRLGYPVVDVLVSLVGGSFTEGESTEFGYRSAVTRAFNKGCEKAGPLLLEPIVKIDVITPSDYMSEIIADMNLRNGEVRHISSKKKFNIVVAFVPLSQMFGYATRLRSISQGRATYSMQLSHYAAIANSVI